MGLENFILTCEKDNKSLRKDIDYYKNYNKRLNKKNQQLKEQLELINNNQTSYARQYRTFGTPIPKKDMDKFPVLEKYKGQDISYIVYESIEIL